MTPVGLTPRHSPMCNCTSEDTRLRVAPESRAYPAGLESGDSQRSADERVWRLDSFWKDRVMAKPYSDDLRVRAIAIVEGGASRHEVAALLEVSPSSVINWLRRWGDDGSS